MAGVPSERNPSFCWGTGSRCLVTNHHHLASWYELSLGCPAVSGDAVMSSPTPALAHKINPGLGTEKLVETNLHRGSRGQSTENLAPPRAPSLAEVCFFRGAFGLGQVFFCLCVPPCIFFTGDSRVLVRCSRFFRHGHFCAFLYKKRLHPLHSSHHSNVSRRT